MFAWRRKPDRGFEWHKYVRTTIKLRRDARRQRVSDAKRVAGRQAEAAGAALVAGSRAAGGAMREGLRAGLGALSLGLQSIGSVLLHALRALARPVVDAVARPNIGGPLAFAGAIALGAGIGRSRGVGLDGEAATTLLIGAVLAASLLPMLARKTTWRPRLSAGGVLMTAGLSVLIAGVAWSAAGGGLATLASVADLSLIGAGETLEGRARALSADTLRIGGTTVKLAGIEAPERRQRCTTTGGRSWRCGAAARTALSRLVDRRRVTCSLSGGDDAGAKLGQCSVGRKDVAAELVRRGHVFAEEGLFARYAGEEREARAAKAGLWRGEAERAAAWRARLWEEARREAPGGCPIKGRVTRGSRVYVLPWSPGYDRVRVREARGERWFCSEQEAAAAGFEAR